MAIIQAGSASGVSQVVPGFNVVIQQPGVALAGAPTSTIGLVGAASWGPLNTPIVFSGTADGTAAFGPVINRTFDMLTHVSVQALQGVQSFRGVRVTDGTDTASTGLLGTGLTCTSRCTGSTGNATTVSLAVGTPATTYQITVANPVLGLQEVFSVATAGLTGNAVWLALAAAINAGTGLARGPSQLIVAAATAVTAAPAAATLTLTSGTDGASGLTAAMLVGVDGLTRTGMYALRHQAISVLNLVDLTDWTQASTVNALAISEGWYAVLGGPAGQTISAAQTSASAAGYGVSLVYGDWLYWTDAVNGLIRLVNPAAFKAGIVATLDPNQSSLNKPIAGIVGSQVAGTASTSQSATLSSAQKQALILAGVDFIANPSPGGTFWAVGRGLNTAGNAAISNDAYTRMTNFLATTMEGGMGTYIGSTITTTLFGNVRATLLGLLGNMVQQGYLDATYGTPYAVVCDTTNNPQSRTGLGYLQADVQVRYEGIVLFLNVNLAGGQTVTVTTTTSAGS